MAVAAAAAVNAAVVVIAVAAARTQTAVSDLEGGAQLPEFWDDDVGVVRADDEEDVVEEPHCNRHNCVHALAGPDEWQQRENAEEQMRDEVPLEDELVDPQIEASEQKEIRAPHPTTAATATATTAAACVFSAVARIAPP